MRISLLAACAAWLLFPGAVLAGWSGFLRLDGVSGESQDASHVGWMDVSAATSANFKRTLTSTNPNPAGVLGPEQALVLTKNLDAASPALDLMCAQGQVIRTGTLDLTTTNTAAPVLRLDLNNIYVISVTQSTSPSGPVEQILLLPFIAQWNYAQFNTNSGLPSYPGAQWNFGHASGGSGTVAPYTITAGIRATNGVQLSWNATSGKSYCVFAEPQLGIPFSPLVSQTATNSGTMTLTMPTANNNALFYVVEQLP